jgi:hypothetical protein
MRFWIIIHLLLSAAVSGLAGDGASRIKKAEDAYIATQTQQDADFRLAVSEAILHATHCEVYLLDSDLSEVINRDPFASYPSDKDHFPIRPYGSESKILKRAQVKGETMQKVVMALAPALGVRDAKFGAGCHYPIHGIRVYDGEILLLETSFCYGCTNCYLVYPFGGARWVGLNTADVEEVLSAIIPIPISKEERFEAKSQEKKAKETKK